MILGMRRDGAADPGKRTPDPAAARASAPAAITAFDINATCLSFLVALDTLLTGMAVGKWRLRV